MNVKRNLEFRARHPLIPSTLIDVTPKFTNSSIIRYELTLGSSD